MYADRIEEEQKSVRARLSGGGHSAASQATGGIRGRISFKRSAASGVLLAQNHGSIDDKWQHDLFQEDEDILNGSGMPAGNDLRAMLSRKARAGGRTAGGARRTGAAARGMDLRQHLAGTQRPARRRQGVLSSVVAASAAQKRITVTVQNEGTQQYAEEEEAEEDVEEEDDDMPPPGIPRLASGIMAGGNLVVSSRSRRGQVAAAGAAEGDAMDVEVKEARKSKGLKAGPSGGASVASILTSLSLQKYIPIFQEEEIDFHALRQMTDEDLKELGIPMGPRKKILQAVAG